MKKIIVFMLIFISISFYFSNAIAGVQINATRVIFDGAEKESMLSVKNTDASIPYLIQSWISDGNENKKDEFVIIPPLFRLDGKEEANIRIRLLDKNLPSDRESLFWLNIKNIAPVVSGSTNRLLVNFRSKIKLIYRPASISKNKEDIFNAYKKITVVKEFDSFTLKNPTPYYMNFNRIVINKKDLMNPGYLEPFSEKQYPNKLKGSVSWQIINDYGGLSDFFSE